MNTFPDSVNKDMVMQLRYPDDPVSSPVFNQCHTEYLWMMFINRDNSVRGR